MSLLAHRGGAGLAMALLGVLVVSGCSGDPQASYCDVVENRQQELGAVIGEGEQDALLRARPIFEELAAAAPRDIAEEWRTVLRAITAVQTAFEEAGADPATYDPENPPESLSDDQRADLERAAAGLLAPRTTGALADVEQHALDVCKTPLTL